MDHIFWAKGASRPGMIEESAAQKRMRESMVEGICGFDLGDILLGQRDFESGNIAIQMVDGSTPNDGEDVWGFLENVRQCHIE
jgi:hypothetical protein